MKPYATATSRGAGITSCPVTGASTGTKPSCAAAGACFGGAGACAKAGADRASTIRTSVTKRFMSVLYGEIERVELLTPLFQLGAEHQDHGAEQREGGDTEPERPAQA